MTNILEAICNIIEYNNFSINKSHIGRNRANSMGNALESYVKDAFANTFNIDNAEIRLEVYNKKFSWLGSQNNPPDIMIKNGDAIEVKKIQNTNSNLSLNSSFPKADLRHTSPMITNNCRTCENWQVKDLIYCIGHTTDTELKSIWMIYGNIYAANPEIYQRIKTTISEGINEIPNVVFSETKELGRVNHVDPLKISSLRIRGMWQIENPKKVFNYLYKSEDSKFELICIIPVKKYNNFPKNSLNRIESIKNNQFSIENKKVKDPNNPAKLIECKLIKYLKST